MMIKKLFFWLMFLSVGMQAQIINFPDANFKAILLESDIDNTIAKKLNGNYFKIDSNNDGEIDITEALQVKEFNLWSSDTVNKIFSAEGINNFLNLEYLNFDYKKKDSPYDFSYGKLKSLDLQGLVKLKHLTLSRQPVVSLNLKGLSNLEDVNVFWYHEMTVPQPSDSEYYLTSINAEGCNHLTSITIDGNRNLKDVNLKDCKSLYNFYVPFHCYGLETLDIQGCNNLMVLDVPHNKLSSLNFLGCNSLKEINCMNNQLTILDVQHLPNLEELYCGFNQLSTLNIESNPKLKRFNVRGNDKLISLFIKNGVDSFGDVGPSIPSEDVFWQTPNLKYICADETEIPYILSDAGYLGLTDISINSYCNFVPGGSSNTISGTVKFDANGNGCDFADEPFEFLKLKINDGINSGETFVQKDGKYEFYMQAGNFAVTALAENPGLFTVSPANFNTNFADANNNTFTQDICITGNGNQNDAEVVIAPLTNARPGFDAVYNLVWRNKGNTILSGKVVLNYDSNKMTFKNSSLPYSVISNGSVEFDYNGLKPFANTASEITFKINTPTDSANPVNSGDVLALNAQITPSNTDINPEDNYFGFNHSVVNSFDPNDIVCLEGGTVPVTSVGKYFHYVVNFENTGTVEAENIVVKMDIDPNEFDINTLQLQNASAIVDTKIVGNKVEFIFKNIKLESGGHGNVLLKMRSKSDLVEGDAVNNVADIYFDYNFPIETNDYVTKIYNASTVLAAKFNYTASDFNTNNYPVHFDASLSTGTIANYQWEFSGNPSIGSSNDMKPTVTYTVPGNYTAKLTVTDADSSTSSKSVSFTIGGNVADISTGKNSDNTFITIDSDDDDWKGYDINGTEITPKVRQTFTGWSNADIGNGTNSQWITLNNYEGYYTYKSREFTVPENATDAKLNLRSLSFVRNWTYLVKVNPDGSEDEIEITKTQWLSDGFKGWVNSRSPKVDNYALASGTYYIKVLVYSNNPNVRESLDVNAIVSCSAGLIYANKKANSSSTLSNDDLKLNEVAVYPIPTKGEVNIVAHENIRSLELFDSSGRILEKKMLNLPSIKFNINRNRGIYFLKIKTDKKEITKKIIKE